MANLNETARWEAGIYQLETSDPVMGGPNGIDNRPARELANRTLWLKNELAKAVSQIGSNKTAADAALALKADKARRLTAGAGLTGGGDLGADRTIALATPATLSGSTANQAGSGAAGHTHELAKATPTLAGVAKLVNALDSSAADAALTAAMGKKLQDEKLPAAALKFARPQVLSGSVAVNLDLTARQSIIDALGDAYIANGHMQAVYHNTEPRHNISGLPLAVKSPVQLDFYLMGGYSFIECRYMLLNRSFSTRVNWNNDTLTLDWKENLTGQNGVMLAGDQQIDGAKTFRQTLTAGRADSWGKIRSPVKNGGHWIWETNPDSAFADGSTLRMGFKYEEGGKARNILFPAPGSGNQTVAYQDWVNSRISAAAGNAVLTVGNQTISGSKTFAARADFAQGLRFSGGGKDQPAALGMGSSDIYLHNPQSNKYLQLKDDGTLAYSNDKILLGSDLSSAVNLADTARPASAAAAKTAYDRGSTALQTAAHAAPPGMIAFFAGDTAPAGWLKANGAQVSRSAYAALFAAIGTHYGAGNGSTTFTLPDLRGIFPRDRDDGRGFDPGRVLGTLQNHQLAEHRHAVGWRHGTAGNEFALIRNEWAGQNNVAADTASQNVAVNYGHQENYTHAAGSSYAQSNDRYATGRAYYDVQAETRPVNVALTACIKV